MIRMRPRRRLLVIGGTISVAALAAMPFLPRSVSAGDDHGGPGRLHGKVLVAAPPVVGDSSPDDITLLSTPGVDAGRAVLWTAYQNGIGPDGTPSSCCSQSTVTGYDAKSGAVVEIIPVTGKVDGLRADTAHGQLVATVNEDANSALNVIDVATGAVTRYTYSPSPEVSGNGGTDSITFWNGQMFISHSNPNDTTQAAVYEVTLDSSTDTANLSALFNDDSTAQDAVSGATAPLALTDPDTDAVVPANAPRFGGQLALISQGDGVIVFASSPSSPNLTVLNLFDGPTAAFPSGEIHPPVDGFAVATTHSGTLYVVDSKGGAAGGGTITALHVSGFVAGTVFVSEANDSGNPLVGTLDLSTGAVQPLPNAFVDPKELLFVPAGNGH